ncbi:sodium:solute symporter [Methanocella sp. CWC-04]|uniref:Sodium:solute symporter n=1 Tax=Methanooceanicella nereidis TaxID=2052831 RepID=A0AAP2RBE1_9EURY|nr:sodium:solute symporter family protein [Methanocella sp. CWC-04]MCD1294218.1 sodium:solute symporter [Methanocella sp. CWC-04]
MAVDTLTFTAVTIIYLIALMALAYMGYKKTKEAEDFMLAGRKVHPALIALSYGATFISTSAIVGFGGTAAYFGMGLIWLTVLNIGIGILLAFVVFGKKTREIGSKLKAVTFPDLMGKIFKSRFMQYASGLIIVVGMPLYASAVLIGGARFIETTFNISYTTALLGFAIITAVYVITGGLLAVIYTDTLQGIIMLVGMTILIAFLYVNLGGITQANEALTEMAGLVPSSLAATGHTGWTSMPSAGSPIWYTLVTTIILGVGIGVLAQPQLVVRFMTAKDDRSLNRAVPIGGVFILMMTGVVFTVGALTNVYFYQKTGMLAFDAAGKNLDSIIPAYINAAMPDWFVILFMLTLLAAAMSTLSALFHTMGTALGNDLLSRAKNYRLTLWKNRAGVTFMIIVSIILAFIMPGSIIARATAMFMGLCASAFLPAFTHGLFSKNPSKRAAITSLVVGSGAWSLWTAFVHIKESEALGLCQILFGKAALLGSPWTVVDPLIIALPLAAMSLAVVWALDSYVWTKKESGSKEPAI